MRVTNHKSYLAWFEQRREEVDSKNQDLFNDETGELRKITMDGPITDRYFVQNLKIMWVLREPNGGGGESLIDYVKGLYDPTINDGIDHLKGGMTYICLAAATYGIIHGTAKYGAWADNRSEIYSILSQISIINLNKFGGGGKLSKPYRQGIDLCKDLVGDQLKRLKPEVIICGGTFGDLKYIKKAPTGLDLSWPVRGNNGRFDAGRNEAGQIHISAYHPGVRPVALSREEYVNRIIKAVRHR